MNPKQRIKDAIDRMETAVENAAATAGDKADTELGIFLHKNIGTLFIFDPTIRKYEQEIIEHARNGNKNDAIMTSQEMQNYLMYQLEHDRRYQSKMKDIADKIEDQADRITSFLQSSTASAIMDAVDDLNTAKLDDYRDQLNNVLHDDGQGE